MGAEQSGQQMGVFSEEGMFCCRGVSNKDAQNRGDFCSRREPAPAPTRGWREERLMRLQEEANQNKARMSGVDEIAEDEANVSHSGEQTRFTPQLYNSSASARSLTRSQSHSSTAHRSSTTSPMYPPEEGTLSPPRTQPFPAGVAAEALLPLQSPFQFTNPQSTYPVDLGSPRFRQFANPHDPYPLDVGSPRRQQQFDYRNTYTKQGMLANAGVNFDFKEPTLSPRQPIHYSPRQASHNSIRQTTYNSPRQAHLSPRQAHLSPRQAHHNGGLSPRSHQYSIIPVRKVSLYEAQSPVTEETEECLL